jgi:hypothetical protein
MRPGREIDCRIAQEVMGYRVFVQKHVLHEETPQGSRPLRFYTREMGDAWEVAQKMNITILPIENNQWFAMVGRIGGWKSPQDFISYLQEGNFVDAGAAMAENAAKSICLAALKAIEVRAAVAGQQAPQGGQDIIDEDEDDDGLATVTTLQ